MYVVFYITLYNYIFSNNTKLKSLLVGLVKHHLIQSQNYWSDSKRNSLDRALIEKVYIKYTL